jgi:DNA/RNA-binding domain of Phe-tRNA-synthetase-like protein
VEPRIIDFQASKRWKQTYPGASMGVLVIRGTSNPESPLPMRAWTKGIEDDIKNRYSGWDRKELEELPVIRAYSAYYRRFKKTYHVLLQLESILKGRSLPRGVALLEVMFSAELKNLLLTAGHDLAEIEGKLLLDAAQGTETYQTLSGESKTLKTGDMNIADEVGVISSVIYGPDGRTKISSTTREVLFTVYSPSGISWETVLNHIEDLREGVLLAAPGAKVEMLEVFSADLKAKHT